jgi:outer membrane protein TolC
MGQQVVDLKTVVSMVVANNTDVQIAELTAEQAENLATYGNAGYWPSLSLNASGTYSNTNTYLEFNAQGFPPTEVNGAVSTGISTGIGLNYVLFEGFGKINRMNRLQQTARLSDLQTRLITENLVLNSVNTYLDLFQLRLNLLSAYRALEISRDQLERVTIGFENGSRTRIEKLTAEINMNADSVAVLNLIQSLANAKIDLNYLAGLNPEAPFVLSNDLPLPTRLTVEEARTKSMENNVNFLLAQLSKEVELSRYKEVQGNQLPTLSLNASYGINQNRNAAGVLALQESTGFNGGVTFSLPLFNGGALKTAIENQYNTVEIRETERKDAERLIKADLAKLNNSLDLIEQQINFQEKNVALAELALERAKESYRNGSIIYTTFREAQLNLLNAENALTQAKIDQLKLRYRLLYIAGDLLDE